MRTTSSIVSGSAPIAPVAAIQASPAPPAPDRTMVVTLGVVLIGGLVVLMLVLSLRLIRRVAEGTPIAAAQKKRTARGAGRDPWREAGRRLVVPPPDASPEGSDSGGDDGGRDGDHDGSRRDG